MNYNIVLEREREKEVYSLGEQFVGESSNEEIGFTNYYMTKDNHPFYGICGEFHFTRCEEAQWHGELLKIKAGGINIISTYVFWNHHEELEGDFNF